MAQVTINIPDEQVQRVVDAFLLVYDDQAEGESISAFIKRHILDFVKTKVRQGERKAHVQGFNYTGPPEVD